MGASGLIVQFLSLLSVTGVFQEQILPPVITNLCVCVCVLIICLTIYFLFQIISLLRNTEVMIYCCVWELCFKGRVKSTVNYYTEVTHPLSVRF